MEFPGYLARQFNHLTVLARKFACQDLSRSILSETCASYGTTTLMDSEKRPLYPAQGGIVIPAVAEAITVASTDVPFLLVMPWTFS
jgi:hypothetical protein